MHTGGTESSETQQLQHVTYQFRAVLLFVQTLHPFATSERHAASVYPVLGSGSSPRARRQAAGDAAPPPHGALPCPCRRCHQPAPAGCGPPGQEPAPVSSSVRTYPVCPAACCCRRAPLVRPHVSADTMAHTCGWKHLTRESPCMRRGWGTEVHLLPFLAGRGRNRSHSLAFLPNPALAGSLAGQPLIKLAHGCCGHPCLLRGCLDLQRSS